MLGVHHRLQRTALARRRWTGAFGSVQHTVAHYWASPHESRDHRIVRNTSRKGLISQDFVKSLMMILKL